MGKRYEQAVSQKRNPKWTINTEKMFNNNLIKSVLSYYLHFIGKGIETQRV